MEQNEQELESQVEQGELSEEQALKLLDSHGPKSRFIKNIDKAYSLYKTKELHEDDFYMSLLRFVEMMIKQNAQDEFTFTNIEDVISETLLELWRRLPSYKEERGSFRAFALSIVRSNIRDAFRKWTKDRGSITHEEVDEESLGPAPGIGIEKRLLFDGWLNGLEPLDRKIAELVMDGAPLREIAAVVGMSFKGVQKRIKNLRYTNPPF
jgi:RNA polymerase sigma factor (sigma-70 family)